MTKTHPIPTRTNAVVAHLEVEHDTPQTGRAVELRVHNHSQHPVAVRFGRADGKGHRTERTVEPTGILRVTPGAGLDGDISVSVAIDGTVQGCTLEVERVSENQART